MQPFLALVYCLWKEIIYLFLSENLKLLRHSGITTTVCTPATTHAFRGAPFCLGRPENLALHQHNQNRRKESWMVHDEVLQWFWKSQTATSHVPIPNKIQEPILMIVNTNFLVSKCLYSWLFLLGSHRYYSELIWKKQYLSEFSVLNTRGEKSNPYVAYQLQKQESLNASKNNCYQLMTVTVFFTLLPLIEVSGIWWESQNGSRNFSDLSYTASVNSQNDQCLNMPCDGNWHNKGSFYPYWIIKNYQYIGRIESLLIHKQGKSHIPQIIYLPWLVLSYQTAVLQ